MKLIKLCKFYHKASLRHHSIQKINDNDMLGYDYDANFKNEILNKTDSDVIRKMLDYGDLRLGLVLKRFDDNLFSEWLEQFCKKYSPLMYPEFEDSVEPFYGQIFDNIRKQL